LPEEVFRPSTLNSLQGKAVTFDHPEDDVTPENYKELLVGTVINPRQGQNAMDNLLLGDLIIYDPQTIKAIRDGKVREVSVGYKADYEETGPARGKQKNILCNHLALVQDGRCGPVCRIGDKAYFPRHEKDCGCAQCGTKDAGSFYHAEREDDDEDVPLPLDKDLRRIAEGAQENIIQALYEEQERREENRPFSDSKRKRTGRTIHVYF